jgi:hypothetical protein
MTRQSRVMGRRTATSGHEMSVAAVVFAATYRTQIYNANADIAFHSVAADDTASAAFYGSSPTSLTIQGAVTTYGLSERKGDGICLQHYPERHLHSDMGERMSWNYLQRHLHKHESSDLAGRLRRTGLAQSKLSSRYP